MHIAFRVDSSTTIGHGHVMRCLTLAYALTRARKKLHISFITKANQGNINHLICNAGFQLVLIATGEEAIIQSDSSTWLGCSIEKDASQTLEAIKVMPAIDLLIVDHYAIDNQWHNVIAPHYQALMVIDDLANRALDCDVLLDQTLNRDAKQYQPLVPEHCQFLLGQDYMLLRDEFSHLQNDAQIRREQRCEKLTQANILISMGGGDPDNLSERAIFAIKNLRNSFPNLTATLVLASQAKHLTRLKALQQELNWCQLITDANNMSELMLNADIAIGASGATAWERCCLGLPSLITINADNQQLIADNLTSAGTSINLGWHEKITSDDITAKLQRLIENPQTYSAMVASCFRACDGQGASKVVKTLLARWQSDDS